MAENLDLAALMAQAQDKIKREEVSKEKSVDTASELKSRELSIDSAKTSDKEVGKLTAQIDNLRSQISSAQTEIEEVDKASETLKKAGMEEQLDALYAQKRKVLEERQAGLPGLQSQLGGRQSEFAQAESSIKAVEDEPENMKKLHEEALKENADREEIQEWKKKYFSTLRARIQERLKKENDQIENGSKLEPDHKSPKYREDKMNLLKTIVRDNHPNKIFRCAGEFFKDVPSSEDLQSWGVTQENLQLIKEKMREAADGMREDYKYLIVQLEPGQIEGLMQEHLITKEDILGSARDYRPEWIKKSDIDSRPTVMENLMRLRDEGHISQEEFESVL